MPQQQQPQKPPVFQEVIITLRNDGTTKDKVVVYRHAIWQIQAAGSGAVLIVSETTGDKESHVFPWDLVQCLDLVPSKIELVGQGGEAS